VEAAFVLLLFVALLIGATDLARIMYIHNAVNERVRSAARKAAIYSYTPDQVKSLVAYNSITPPSGTDFTSNSPGFQGITPSNVSVEVLDASSNDKRIQVIVTGMRIVTLSPWMRGVAGNIPVQFTVPLETP
jgi:hypothetical protein